MLTNTNDKQHEWTFVTTKIQGPKLRFPGRQCDQEFSPGDQNFIAGCYCGLKRSEKLIKN